jgi:pyruvate/2-oxoglutarate dehydrogenase complex dihydrolipoamide dehydrogenase (E3) component
MIQPADSDNIAGPHAQDSFDVVVIGTGSAGQPLAAELVRAGRSVLAIEDALVGGECAFLACIPSKAMLLAARRHRLKVGPRGSTEPNPAAYAQAVAVRDRTSHYRDDSGEARELEKNGVTLLRGRARIDGRSVTIEPVVAGNARTVHWRQALVLATGAEAIMPAIDGLAATAAAWISPDALSAEELPGRLTILGGGPIGCELAQVYASFGSTVTLIQTAPTLLPREPAWVGEAMAEVLRQVGVDVRTGTTATAVDPGTPALVHTADGASIPADRILVAVGKRPRSNDLGLETLGVSPQPNGAVAVDARCRVLAENATLDDVYAIGDLTAIASYTHAANYQARLVAAHLLGRGVDADHVGIPRVVYTDPPVLCAGETAEAARERGANVLTAEFDVTKTSRSAVERSLDPDDRRPAGLQLIADADTGVLLGVAAIGPEADSWAAELALAVRTRMTVHTLAQHLHAFPSWTEAIHIPARELAERIPDPNKAEG